VDVGPARYRDVIDVLTSLPPSNDVPIRIESHYGDADSRVEWRQGHPDHFSAIHGEAEAPRTTCSCSRATVVAAGSESAGCSPSRLKQSATRVACG
jgi:hypothetical protein